MFISGLRLDANTHALGLDGGKIKTWRFGWGGRLPHGYDPFYPLDALALRFLSQINLPSLFRAAIDLGMGASDLCDDFTVRRQAKLNAQIRSRIADHNIESRFSISFRQMGYERRLVRSMH
jgi:hypothetical protein